jgi:hypothetical protein
MLRLRARGGGEFRAPERELLLSPAKKVTKKRHLKLRFKTSLRGEGKCKFDGADFAEWARWVSLSVQGIACTSCAAAADAVWR